MPIDYKKYPANWKTVIRPAIMKRANDCCEFCGVQNYAFGVRENGKFVHAGTGQSYKEARQLAGKNMVVIVLTIAHINHDISNNGYENLKALCQQCHNRHDADFRKNNRKKKMTL